MKMNKYAALTYAADGVTIIEPDACADCFADQWEDEPYRDEYYMVHDELWEAAGYRDYQRACIGCLEKRISRKLTRDDFTEAPINIPGHRLNGKSKMSERLLDRLTTAA